MTLSWSLVIATYRRERVLPACLRLAAAQTRPPRQIIVIDASPQWEATRDRVFDELRPRAPAIEWIYEPAAQLGSTKQRNQGLGRASSDVAFLIDDDSLMFPDCAEKVMAVYEADAAGRVAGVQAELTSESPVAQTSDLGEAKLRGDGGEAGRGQGGRRAAVWRWLNQHLFLMSAEALFLPYDGDYPRHDALPSPLSERATPVRLFHGCRMTFRRRVITQVGFEPLMAYYAAGEDLDASYRASRQGPLLTAREARLHHYTAASGRLDRAGAIALGVLNQALCLRLHSNDLGRDRRRLGRLLRRRLLAELLKDTLSRRWSLPQVRGLLRARRELGGVLNGDLESLRRDYADLQQRIRGS